MKELEFILLKFKALFGYCNLLIYETKIYIILKLNIVNIACFLFTSGCSYRKDTY